MHPQPRAQPHTHIHRNTQPTQCTHSETIWCLHPGVGRAGELIRPVWRPPRSGVEVHVVGVGFESERLAGVALRGGWGQVKRLVVVVLLAVALWGRQVHSVAVVVLPVGFVIEWLRVLGDEGQEELVKMSIIFKVNGKISWNAVELCKKIQITVKLANLKKLQDRYTLRLFLLKMVMSNLETKN